jgi:hypothetical protein
MELGKILLSQYSNDKITVYQVNGFYVRNNIFLDYTQGGNDQKYTWIPAGEIWLDKANRIEFSFIALHELTERRLMAGGMIYEQAHDQANVAEKQTRVNPESAMDLIKAELERQL